MSSCLPNFIRNDRNSEKKSQNKKKDFFFV